MKLLNRIIENKFWYLYIAILSFSLLKMARGMNGVESSSGGIWNVIQLLFMAVGYVFFFKYYGKQNHSINLLLFSLFWMMFVSILNMSKSPIVELNSVFKYLITPLPAFVALVFYCIGYRCNITDFSFLIKATYYILIAMFYFSMTNYRVYSLDDEYIAFSDIYFSLCLLPIVLIYTSPSFSLIPFASIFIGVLVSGKRGGFIAIVLTAFIYYFVGNKEKKSKRFLMLVLLIAAIVAGTYFIQLIDSSYGLHTLDRLEGTMDDGGSGRASRWNNIMDTMANSSIWRLLIGFGYNAVYSLIGGRAHNDFLEVFYNFGTISLLLYVSFYVSLIRTNIKMYRKKYAYAKYFTCIIVISLLLALVSFYIVDPIYVLMGMFSLGLILGDWQKYKTNNYNIVNNED